MNDHQLSRLLDASFGDGPTLPAPERRLLPARRALRRRRLATGGATAAVLVVAVTAAMLGTGGGTGSRAIEPTAPDSSTPTPAGTGTTTPAPATTTPDAPTRPTNGADVELAADGTVLTARGVEVTERVTNPLSSVLPTRSLGITYTLRGSTYWALLEYSPGGGYVSWDPAGKAYDTLQQWLDSMVALQTGEPGLSLVRFGPGETLRPEAGVEILDQTADVDIASFAGPDDKSAAAMVSYEGRRWFVLARDLGGVPDYIPTTGGVGGPDLAAFLDYATEQYAGGEGLR